MRALVCVISSFCIALLLLSKASAQAQCTQAINLSPVLFDGLLFTIAPTPGPVSFSSATIPIQLADSIISGEIFLGMAPAANMLAGMEDMIPGLTLASNVASPAHNGEIFDHGDKVLLKYALMIDADPDDLNDPSLYHFINQWYGVRYKFGGTTPGGIDCSALSQKTYGAVYNVPIRRTSKQQYRHSTHFKKYTEAEEGDLVFFRINRVRISHVGIYLANGYFVHASRSKGVIISSLTEKYWKRRYAGCGRIIREVRGDMESAFVD